MRRFRGKEFLFGQAEANMGFKCKGAVWSRRERAGCPYSRNGASVGEAWL